MDAPVVRGLSDEQRQTLGRLWAQWQAQLVRNQRLDLYYDSDRRLKDLGVSIPPQIKNAFKGALGWPAKAVTYLARKHRFEGFSLDGVLDPYGVESVLSDNAFEQELQKAINSCYKHGCAFIATFPVESDTGQRVCVRTYSARNATVLVDQRTGETVGALVITQTNSDKTPKAFTVYFPDTWVNIESSPAMRTWQVTDTGELLGGVPVQTLVYDPTVDRPFGRSRISREVRYLTDAALRTLARAETAAEFFAAPQRYVLGASESAFASMDKWTAITGRILALDVNDEGNNPTVGQFAQMSMEPHLAQYRQLAQNFCAETNLPMSAVGLFTDNPASAEAMQAAEAALSEDAEYQWRVFAPALRRVLGDVVRLQWAINDAPEGDEDAGVFVPALDDLWRVQVKWKPARYVSPQASSDYIMKIVQAFPEIAGTTVAYRLAGFSKVEIDELLAEVRASDARKTLDRLFAEPVNEGITKDEAPPRF